MSASNRKHWKIGALSASLLVASTVAGYSGVKALTGTPADPNQTTTATATPSYPQPRGPFNGGRHGGHGGELQGMNTNPPAVEMAPTLSPDVTPSADATQPVEKAADAQFYDGQYYGDAISAGRWGTMQVVAVIEDGKLADVLIAQYPNHTYESDIITRNALPTLISEAITAQSSNVDFVSRATDSSRAFVSSLNSALLDAEIGMDL